MLSEGTAGFEKVFWVREGKTVLQFRGILLPSLSCPGNLSSACATSGGNIKIIDVPFEKK